MPESNLIKRLSSFLEFNHPIARREVIASQSPLVTSRFYTRCKENYVDFGTQSYFESNEAVGTEEFSFHIHWTEQSEKFRKTVIILVPGLYGTSESLALQEYLLLEKGFTTVVHDSRGIGVNDGLRRSFGYLESNDISNVASFIKDRFGSSCEIGVFGVCSGATTALSAAIKNPHIHAVSVEGTYTHSEGLINFLWPWDLESIGKIKSDLGIESSMVSPLAFGFEFPNIPLRMCWGGSDSSVSTQDREFLIDRYGTRSKKFEFETVERGLHSLQYGFPLSKEDAKSYFIRNINFFDRHLRCE
jgi:dienelactone hydrolase